MEITKEIIFNTNLFQNETVEITYKGYLFKANSTDVSIVYGYGDNWENQAEQPMKRTLDGFKANIEIKEFNKINFCFKNSYEEWDNNNFQDYHADILPPVLPLETDYSDITEVNVESINEKANLLEDILNEYTLYFDNKEEFNVSKFVDKIVDDIVEDARFMHSLSEDVIQENTVVNAEISDIVNYELGQEASEDMSSSNIEQLGTDLVKEFKENVNYIKSEIDNIYIQDIQEIDLGLENIKNYKATVEEENIIESSTTDEYVPVAENVSLIDAQSSKFVVAARKLTPFYRFQKRIRLFFYKALNTIPKILSGEYSFDKEND